MTIANAPLIETPKGSDKLPASDGSGQPRSLTLQQIKEFVGADSGGDGLLPPMSMEEYDALEEKLQTLYFIIDLEGVERIYYGTVLIARRRQGGEDVGTGFPYVFPIIFG